jgi:hypothetical protein
LIVILANPSCDWFGLLEPFPVTISPTVQKLTPHNQAMVNKLVYDKDCSKKFVEGVQIRHCFEWKGFKFVVITTESRLGHSKK